MMRTCVLLVIVAAVTALAGPPPTDQELLKRVAAGRGTASPMSASVTQPEPAEDASAAEEAAARDEANLALAKLELVLARKALRDGQRDEAGTRARQALSLLRQLTAGVDASEYELQAEGILARVGGATPPPAPPAQPEMDMRALRRAYREDHRRALQEADEALLIPDREITYPPDWPQRMARRQQYAGGRIARTPSWFDADGNEWYAAIYDIRDLCYVPPDFTLSGTFGVFDPLRDALDRDALRRRSFIFGGGAGDLAAGLPLLPHFGGVNPWVARQGTYSRERAREIVRMLQVFTGARVIEPGDCIPPAPQPPAPISPSD